MQFGLDVFIGVADTAMIVIPDTFSVFLCVQHASTGCKLLENCVHVTDTFSVFLCVQYTSTGCNELLEDCDISKCGCLGK